MINKLTSTRSRGGGCNECGGSGEVSEDDLTCCQSYMQSRKDLATAPVISSTCSFGITSLCIYISKKQQKVWNMTGGRSIDQTQKPHSCNLRMGPWNRGNPGKCADNPLIWYRGRRPGVIRWWIVALSTIRRDRSCASVVKSAPFR